MKYSLLVQAGRKLLMCQAADWRVMMDEFLLTCLHAFSFPGYESALKNGLDGCSFSSSLEVGRVGGYAQTIYPNPNSSGTWP